MKAHGFGGQLVVSEIVPEDLAEVEKLLEDQKTVAAVPDELELSGAAAAASFAAVAKEPAQPAAVPVVAASAAGVAEPAPAPTPEVVPATVDLSIKEIEGIGPAYAEKLARIGIRTAAELLAAGARPSGARGSLARPRSAATSSSIGSTRSTSCGSRASGHSTATSSRLPASARPPSSPIGTRRTSG